MDTFIKVEPSKQEQNKGNTYVIALQKKRRAWADQNSFGTIVEPNHFKQWCKLNHMPVKSYPVHTFFIRDVLRENDTVVVSKVGDAGLSLPVDRIVEIDFQFGSRQEAGQRLLRAAYDTGRRAEFHTLMTPREFENYSKRACSPTREWDVIA